MADEPHTPDPVQPESAGPAGPAGAAEEESGGSAWDRRLAEGFAFLRRRVTGDYEVDEFGYDKELTDQVLMSLIRPSTRTTSASR